MNDRVNKAASTMSVYNKRTDITTDKVNQCQRLDTLYEWLDEVVEDVVAISAEIRKGNESKATLDARFSQLVLCQQITNRLRMLHNLYQEVYDKHLNITK